MAVEAETFEADDKAMVDFGGSERTRYDENAWLRVTHLEILRRVVVSFEGLMMLRSLA